MPNTPNSRDEPGRMEAPCSAVGDRERRELVLLRHVAQAARKLRSAVHDEDESRLVEADTELIEALDRLDLEYPPPTDRRHDGSGLGMTGYDGIRHVMRETYSG